MPVSERVFPAAYGGRRYYLSVARDSGGLSGCFLQGYAEHRGGGIFGGHAGFPHRLGFHTIAAQQLGAVESVVGVGNDGFERQVACLIERRNADAEGDGSVCGLECARTETLAQFLGELECLLM